MIKSERKTNNLSRSGDNMRFSSDKLFNCYRALNLHNTHFDESFDEQRVLENPLDRFDEQSGERGHSYLVSKRLKYRLDIGSSRRVALILFDQNVDIVMVASVLSVGFCDSDLGSKLN